MLNDHRTFLTTLLVSAAALIGPISGADAGTAWTTLETSTTSTPAPDSTIHRITDQLTGTWSTIAPYEVRDSEDGGSQEIFMMMSIQPITIDGMDNLMYAESVLSDTPWSPFRQAVFQLYEYKGKVRLRTYTLAVSENTLAMLTGMNAVPSQFQGVTKDQLIATLDVELSPNAKGFSGSTPYPYPTGVLGAVEMTSSVTFDGTTLTTADRGYDAEGNVVWGAGEDASYTFEKADPYTVVTEREGGLIVIDYPSSGSDMVVEDGDMMHMHYSGYLTNGQKFDSSYDRGSPYGFIFPPGSGAIVGWGMGMEGMTQDAHRKLIIPSELGYMERGNPRANIPGDSMLVFNVFCAHLDKPEPAPADESTDDHTHDEMSDD